MSEGENAPYQAGDDRLAVSSILQELTVAAMHLFDPSRSADDFMQALATRMGCHVALCLEAPEGDRGPLSLRGAAGLARTSRGLALPTVASPFDMNAVRLPYPEVAPEHLKRWVIRDSDQSGHPIARIGWLLLYFEHEPQLAHQYRGMLQRLAGHLAVAWEHRRLYERLIERERTLKEKAEELENANQAKDRFLATMSHELRTPLNAILGFTSTLLMRDVGPLTPEQEDQLSTIKRSGRHLLSLINDVLDVAKVESGRTGVTLEPVVCRDLIAEVAATLRPLAESKSLAFEILQPDPDLVIRTDRRALSQILINLTNNAIKYTDCGGVILTVRQRRHEGRVLTQISIADTGVGIRPDDHVRLFRAFSQVDASTTRRHEGTGLGLYLSQKLAELIGGRITYQTEHGKGSVFTLTLDSP